MTAVKPAGRTAAYFPLLTNGGRKPGKGDACCRTDNPQSSYGSRKPAHGEICCITGVRTEGQNCCGWHMPAVPGDVQKDRLLHIYNERNAARTFHCHKNRVLRSISAKPLHKPEYGGAVRSFPDGHAVYFCICFRRRSAQGGDISLRTGLPPAQSFLSGLPQNVTIDNIRKNVRRS